MSEFDPFKPETSEPPSEPPPEPPHDQSQGPKRKPGPSDLTPVERIEQMAEGLLFSTGRRPSTAAVAEAKRLAREAARQADPSVPDGPQDQVRVTADPSLPPGTVELRKDDTVVATMENVEEGPPEPPETQALRQAQKPLPPDIEKIWGRTDWDRKSAQILIDSWGLDVFRGSALHQLALNEHEREAKMEPIRTAFVAAHEKKTKTKEKK